MYLITTKTIDNNLKSNEKNHIYPLLLSRKHSISSN